LGCVCTSDSWFSFIAVLLFCQYVKSRRRL
jgi:hypothetical protein